MISFYIPGDKTSLFPRPGILSPSLVLPACLSCPGTGIFFTVTPEHKKATGDAIRRQWLDILFPQLIIFWEKFSSKQHSCVALQGSQLYSFSPRAAPASGVLALGCVLAAPLEPWPRCGCGHGGRWLPKVLLRLIRPFQTEQSEKPAGLIANLGAISSTQATTI